MMVTTVMVHTGKLVLIGSVIYSLWQARFGLIIAMLRERLAFHLRRADGLLTVLFPALTRFLLRGRRMPREPAMPPTASLMDCLAMARSDRLSPATVQLRRPSW